MSWNPPRTLRGRVDRFLGNVFNPTLGSPSYRGSRQRINSFAFCRAARSFGKAVPFFFPPKVLNLLLTTIVETRKYCSATSCICPPDKPFEHSWLGNVKIAFAPLFATV